MLLKYRVNKRKKHVKYNTKTLKIYTSQTWEHTWVWGAGFTPPATAAAAGTRYAPLGRSLGRSPRGAQLKHLPPVSSRAGSPRSRGSPAGSARARSRDPRGPFLPARRLGPGERRDPLLTGAGSSAGARVPGPRPAAHGPGRGPAPRRAETRAAP